MNDQLELTDRSYSVSNIEDYFDYIIKKHETGTDNISMEIYEDEIENRITFRVKKGIIPNY